MIDIGYGLTEKSKKKVILVTSTVLSDKDIYKTLNYKVKLLILKFGV